MIGTRLLSLWDGLMGCAATLAIIILAFCIMVRTVAPGDVPRRLGIIVGIVILLIMLPAIIVSLWNVMSFGQHLGIIALGVAIVFLLGSSRRRPTNAKRR